MSATSHFLHSKNQLSSIEFLGSKFKEIVLEKVKINEAWASDAFHLKYLLNSYQNWNHVSNSKDTEIKEIVNKIRLVARSMEGISSSAEEQTASLEEISATANKLDKLAENLKASLTKNKN